MTLKAQRFWNVGDLQNKLLGVIYIYIYIVWLFLQFSLFAISPHLYIKYFSLGVRQLMFLISFESENTRYIYMMQIMSENAVVQQLTAFLNTNNVYETL